MKPALLTLTALLATAAPAAAAPSLTPLKPCYVSAIGEEQETSEVISLTGSGFTPGSSVAITLDGNAAGRVDAGSDGTLVYGLSAPLQRRGQREFTVTATEAGGAAASVTSLVSALSARVRPQRAKASQTVTFTGRGFTDPAAPVYVHYTLGGRNRKTVRLARPTGPCGTFTVRRRQFPMRRPASGRWTLRIDQDPRYRDMPVKPAVLIDATVRRRMIKG